MIETSTAIKISLAMGIIITFLTINQQNQTEKDKTILIHIISYTFSFIFGILIVSNSISKVNWNERTIFPFIKKKFEVFQLIFIFHFLLCIFSFCMNPQIRNSYPKISVYACILVVYHLSEFSGVLFFRSEQLEINSFLLYHSLYYQTCFFLCLIEYYCWIRFNPESKTETGLFSLLGLFCSVFGLCLRFLAFFSAKENFNHLLNREKSSHRIISNGIFAIERHPSYVGFFLFAVGNQIWLKNYFCSAIFFVVLLVFFTERISREESSLENIHKGEYSEYKEKVFSFFDYVKLPLKTFVG